MVSIVTVDCHVLYNYAGVFTPPGQITHGQNLFCIEDVF